MGLSYFGALIRKYSTVVESDLNVYVGIGTIVMSFPYLEGSLSSQYGNVAFEASLFGLFRALAL